MPSSCRAAKVTGSFSFEAGASDRSACRSKRTFPVWRSMASAADDAGELPRTASAFASRAVSGSAPPAACEHTTSATTTASSPLRTGPLLPRPRRAGSRPRGRWATRPLRAPLDAARIARGASFPMVDVLQKIQAILSTKSGDLDSIERTLTDGYAHALSLEAEKWRLERRLTEAVQGIDEGDTVAKAREISSIAERIDGNQDELEHLRGVLADLRRHADGLRIAS